MSTKTTKPNTAKAKASTKPTPAKVKASTKRPPEAAKAVTAKPQQSDRGRPSLYRDEYCQMLIDFFSIGLTRTETVETKDGEEKIEKNNLFPTLTRFASTIGVTRETLWHWATEQNSDGTLKHPDFFNTYMRARDLQESLLIEGGMAGMYEPRFASLAAKNLIGWRDRTDVEQQTTLITPTTEQLDAFYAEQMKGSKALDAKAKGRAERVAGLLKGHG